MFPYFSGYIDKAHEKQKIVTVLTAISNLRKNAVSYMAVGEIAAVGNDLVFFLDNREIERIILPGPPVMKRGIYFNRFGIASGGDILIKFKRYYRIVIDDVSGKITVF